MLKQYLFSFLALTALMGPITASPLSTEIAPKDDSFHPGIEDSFDVDSTWDMDEDQSPSPDISPLVRRDPKHFTFFRSRFYTQSCGPVGHSCNEGSNDLVRIHTDCNGGGCNGDRWRDWEYNHHLCDKKFKVCGTEYQLKYTGKQYSCMQYQHFSAKGEHHGRVYANLMRGGKKIPIRDIWTGVQWPYPEQIIKSWREIQDPNHPWCTRKALEYTVRFKVWSYEYQRIEASLMPVNFYLMGTNEYYAKPVERPLPLGTGDYNNSQWVLGVQFQDGNPVVSRGYWSNDTTLMLQSRRSTIASWIEDCQSNHPLCGQNSAERNVFPTRLIDVGDTGKAHPKLVSTANLAHTPRYTTLSHCWGPDPSKMPLRTLKETYEAFTNSIPMSSLPRTFHDAVNVTLALNIRYIWIDSLCIIQDDLEDWQQEAAKMAAIYEGSFLTLAAVDSLDSSAGLFLDTVDGPARFDFASAEDSATVSTAFLRPLLSAQSNSDSLHLYNAPLYQRGWVFQEMMLSQRSLHFRKQQMYWRCRRGLQSEDGTLDESKQDSGFLNLFSKVVYGQDDLTGPVEANGTWWKWVEHYTSRTLTKAEDRIAAITGMIHHFQTRTAAAPVLGLWESTFISDLHWGANGGGPSLPLTGPSWSWLFHPGKPIFYQKIGYWHGREKHPLEPQLDSYSIKWKSSEFTSALASANLFLNAAIRTFTVRGPRDGEYRPRATHPTMEGWSPEVEYTLDDGTEIAVGSQLTCLFLYYTAEHIDTDDADGHIQYESYRSEYFLVLGRKGSGSLASDPIILDDNDRTRKRKERCKVWL
ncbi:heterokaryon incompatibility protein-domain-containing protein [Stachybotrys elegans]|uniref:Heterokaryon incompatibility protein-domain-containing protein n=1 Tax=Stachybotrys elegans TaxID=80388 RepID=A0A8K0SX22_9HYPO|nr:heterokaryon incompatibility protein-domain-containing protein [Stachybotrys elegans]